MLATTLRQCKSLNRELKGKLRHLSRNNTRHLNERAAMLKETVAKLDTFHKASMSKAVQQSASHGSARKSPI